MTISKTHFERRAIMFFAWFCASLALAEIAVDANWSDTNMEANNAAVISTTGNGARHGPFRNGRPYKFKFNDGTVAWFVHAMMSYKRFSYIPGTKGIEDLQDVLDLMEEQAQQKLEEWRNRNNVGGGSGEGASEFGGNAWARAPGGYAPIGGGGKRPVVTCEPNPCTSYTWAQ